MAKISLVSGHSNFDKGEFIIWFWLIVKDQLQSYRLQPITLYYSWSFSILLIKLTGGHLMCILCIYIYVYTMYVLYIMYIIYIWYYILYVFDVPLANVITDYLDIWNQFNNLLNFIWIVTIWLNDFSGFGCHDCQWSWHGKFELRRLLPYGLLL